MALAEPARVSKRLADVRAAPGPLAHARLGPLPASTFRERTGARFRPISAAPSGAVARSLSTSSNRPAPTRPAIAFLARPPRGGAIGLATIQPCGVATDRIGRRTSARSPTRSCGPQRRAEQSLLSAAAPTSGCLWGDWRRDWRCASGRIATSAMEPVESRAPSCPRFSIRCRHLPAPHLAGYEEASEPARRMSFPVEFGPADAPPLTTA